MVVDLVKSFMAQMASFVLMAYSQCASYLCIRLIWFVVLTI